MTKVATLRLYMLGMFQVEYNNQPIHIPSVAIQKLLAILGLNLQNQDIRTIVASCWPTAREETAYTHLQQAVAWLNNTLGGKWVVIHQETVRLNNNVDVIQSDVLEFEAALIEVDSDRVTAVSHAHLRHAVNLYHGNLLPDWDDDWLMPKRKQLKQKYLKASEKLVSILVEQEEYAQALPYARVLQQRNPLYEATYRQLTHRYVLSGSRAEACAALERRLDAVAQGHGSLVLINGVAGIGKTSLALAYQTAVQDKGMRFITGHCYRQGASPFLPWLELLQALGTDIERETLPEPFGSAPPAQSALQLTQAVVEYLQTAVTRQPLIFILDDLHWADQDSLNLLEKVTRNIQQTPLLIIATYRSEEVQSNHPLYTLLPTLHRNRPTETIQLTSLTLKDTTHLVEATLGSCTPSLARYLHQRAEGHTLFLVELLHDLIEQSLLIQDNQGHWYPPAQNAPVPTLLQQIIIRRVASLGQPAQTFLALASVIGEVWPLSIVEQLLTWSEDTLLDILEKALASRIIITEDEQAERYRFAHGLIREVLYNRQLVRRRKNLHAQIATLLEKQTAPDEAALTYHYYEADDWDKAYQYGLLAGDKARQRHASHNALHFYQRAISCLQRKPELATLEEQIPLYEKIGELHSEVNQKEKAADVYVRVVEITQAIGDKLMEGKALFWAALYQDKAYHSEAANITRQAALQLAEEIGDPYLLTLNHRDYGFRHLIAGELEPSLHHLEQAEKNARKIEDIETLIETLRYQGAIAIFQGRYEEAEQFLLTGYDIAKTKENAFSPISMMGWAGLTFIEHGLYAQAYTILYKALSSLKGFSKSHLLRIRIQNMLSHLHNELGDFEQAIQHSQAALTASQRDGAYYNIEATCYALLDMSTHYLHSGRLDEISQYIHEFEKICNRTDYGRFRYMNRYQLLQVEIALAQGQFEQALEHTVKARQAAEFNHMRKNIVKCLLYEGQALLGLGQPQQAVAQLQKAMQLADEIAHGSLRWKTRLRLAEAQAHLSQANGELYRQALNLIEGIVNNLPNDKLRETFLTSPLVTELKANAHSSTGAFHSTSSSTSSTQVNLSVSLTKRETEVLRLVVQGQTDRQISEVLHISIRTVNTHITNILNKTNCDNRTAAATFAIQHKLI